MHFPPPRRAAAVFALLAAACSPPAPDDISGDDAAPPAGASLLPDWVPSGARGCGKNGALATTLYGAVPGPIDWTAADMACDGMPRPNGAGARLRFAGKTADDALSVAIIIGIPALEPGVTASEVPSNVTLIEEGAGRFFSTTNLENCWTDITAQTPLGNEADRHEVSGILYCIAPLAEVNGEASVSIPELVFTGVLDWSST